MIIYTNADFFESPAKVLVNTVNTRGTMGKGIALRFKQIYPEMFKQYQEHCKNQSLTIGKLFLYKTPHKWILNFPTKEHWRKPSRVEYIEAGLRKFHRCFAETGVTSIAFPKLGCGNGDLDFEIQVKPLMDRFLVNLPIPTLIHIGQKDVCPAEQHGQKRIEEWLRSEPISLPFDEVWQEIVELLQNKNKFVTRTKGNAYTAVALDDPPALQVASAGRSFRIVDQELVDFWQQLRDFGLTHRSIAPNSRYLSYLMSVFGRLPYVRPVVISVSAERLRTNPEAALQMIPFQM